MAAAWELEFPEYNTRAPFLRCMGKTLFIIHVLYFSSYRFSRQWIYASIKVYIHVTITFIYHFHKLGKKMHVEYPNSLSWGEFPHHKFSELQQFLSPNVVLVFLVLSIFRCTHDTRLAYFSRFDAADMHDTVGEWGCNSMIRLWCISKPVAKEQCVKIRCQLNPSLSWSWIKLWNGTLLFNL